MSLAWLLLLLFVLAVAIGVIIEVPKIITHHINQPQQRRRSEAAARKTLLLLIGSAFVALALVFLLVR